MPEYTKRPPISQVEVRCLVDGTMTRRRGPDLNTVLRGVLVQMRNTMGISTSELARRIGVKQQSLAAMLSDRDDRGFSLSLISSMCAALEIDVGELFSMHPQYGSSEDQSLTEIRAVTTEEERRALSDAVQLCSTLGIVRAQTEQMQATAEAIAKATGAADITRKKARR